MMCEGVYQSMRCWEFSALCDVEVPELDVAAFADERMAHQIKRQRRDGDDAGDEEDCLGAGELHGGVHLCTMRRLPSPGLAPLHRTFVMAGLVPAIHVLV